VGKQIRFDDSARESLRRGVEQLAGAVRVTLGPRWRNVVIDHGRGGLPSITNDGLTIAREIELENPFENMGAQLVKEVALKTGEVAGDGTTTATVLTHGVVSRGLKAIAAGHNPMALKRGIDHAVGVVVDELRRQSRSVRDRADILQVALVSAKVEPRVGELIADAIERVGKQGVITVGESRGLETTLQVVEGIRFERGYLSPYFVTDPETMTSSLESALVVLSAAKVSAVQDLLPVLELAAQKGRPLLVIAEDIEAEALATLVVNRLRGTLMAVAVRAPEAGERRRQMLEDLAVLTGARLYGPELGLTLAQFRAADFGRVKRAVVERDHTTLLEGGGKPAEIRRRITLLERELESSGSDYDRDWLRQRLGRLSSGVAVIHVGAPTELAMAERKARVEDALAATRAAVEEGLVAGGGVALLRAQPRLTALDLAGDERVGLEIVARALEEPARQIAVNAGAEGDVVVRRIRDGQGSFGFNALTGEFGDLEAFGIIDPTKVTRCALQHAASIGSLVLTTDAIVVDAPEEDGEAGEEGGQG
jgi:chaperonin GroEL